MHRPDVLKFFAEHHWVASVEQLHDLGVDDSAIYRARQRRARPRARCAASSSSAGVELSFEGRALLAQLAGRRTRRSSAARPPASIHGLRAMPRSTIEVTVSEQRRLTLPAWIRVVRTSWIGERPRRRRPAATGSAWPRRCGCCSGWPPSSTSTASSGRPRTCGTRGSSRPTTPGSTSSSIRRSGRTGVAPDEHLAGEDGGAAAARPRAGWSSTSSR